MTRRHILDWQGTKLVSRAWSASVWWWPWLSCKEALFWEAFWFKGHSSHVLGQILIEMEEALVAPPKIECMPSPKVVLVLLILVINVLEQNSQKHLKKTFLAYTSKGSNFQNWKNATCAICAGSCSSSETLRSTKESVVVVFCFFGGVVGVASLPGYKSQVHKGFGQIQGYHHRGYGLGYNLVIAGFWGFNI